MVEENKVNRNTIYCTDTWYWYCVYILQFIFDTGIWYREARTVYSRIYDDVLWDLSTCYSSIARENAEKVPPYCFHSERFVNSYCVHIVLETELLAIKYVSLTVPNEGTNPEKQFGLTQIIECYFILFFLWFQGKSENGNLNL